MPIHRVTPITFIISFTCLHCHNKSMIGRDVAYIDSIFLDPNGNEFHALDFPEIPEIRAYPLLRLDTLVQNRPVKLASTSGSLLDLAEWMTGQAHMNGVVDVDFDKSSIDTAMFNGQTATFHPEKLTCSATSCHPSPGDYRWAIPSKGLPILKGEDPIAP
jgi:pyruvate-formate lyase-activating enzyme